MSRADLLEYATFRKLEAEGLSQSSRQEYLLEVVIQEILWICEGLGRNVKVDELRMRLSHPDFVHIQKPVSVHKIGAAEEMRKATQDVGEWILSYAQKMGVVLTKKHG